MKKMSIALVLGLFAVGCSENAPPKPASPPAAPDPKMMMEQMQKMHKAPEMTPPAAGGKEETKADAPAAAETPKTDAPAAEAPK